MMGKASVLLGVLLLQAGDALDVRLERIKCNNKLPVSLVETTFKVTCNGRERCSFDGRDTARIKGHFVLIGVQDAGLSGTKAYVEASLQTMTGDYELVDGAMVDLCSTDGSEDDDAAATNNDDAAAAYNDDAAAAYNDDAAAAYNDDAAVAAYNDDAAAAAYNDDAAAAYNDDAAAANNDDAAAANNDDAAAANNDDAVAANSGDDAYNGYYNANAYGNANNDGESCPDDGVYRFSTNFAIPQQRHSWMATGWSASGQINMYTYDGDIIGTCNLKFSTTTSHRAATSRTVFAYAITLFSVALFVCVFIGVRRGSGFSPKDDARVFHRLRDDVVKSTNFMRRKKPLTHDDVDTSFETRATSDLDTTYTHDTSGTDGTRFSRAWFA